MSIKTGRLHEWVRPDADVALALADCQTLEEVQVLAALIRDAGHGTVVTYSSRVLIPLTPLAGEVGHHHHTVAQGHDAGRAPYLTPDAVLDIARAGVRAGCHEAFFTLADQPELRSSHARKVLATLGYDSTLSYLADMARRVQCETGLLPHLNAGVMSEQKLQELRAVSVSQGLMLDSFVPNPCDCAEPHHGSPDRQLALRLEMIAAAGRLKIPFTSGIRMGIGETRQQRIKALLALRDLDDEYGHLQEIVIQNYRRAPDAGMAGVPESTIEDLCWTVAVARLIFGAQANIQVSADFPSQSIGALIRSGANDLGGVSQVTPAHVNPEALSSQLCTQARETEMAGKILVQRLPLYPARALQLKQWVDPGLQQAVRSRVDAGGFPRTDVWSPGKGSTPPPMPGFPPVEQLAHFLSSEIYHSAEKAARGMRLSEQEVTRLFNVRGGELHLLCAAADELRIQVKGNDVSYTANCNINYTNICVYKCQFCAFSKGKVSEGLRDKGYSLPLADIQQRAADAWDRGANEVCLQGGIHPSYTGQTYLDICRTIKAARPDLHIHAFSPLEVWQGATTLGVPLREYLMELKAAGLGSLPGTAAEILDDGIRRTLCPDKLTVKQWEEVMRTAHDVGLKSTATIMYGHIEQLQHWARHLLFLRDLQEESGGFTEFVPLPFVHMQTPIYRRGQARPGPTFREAVLMHAVARLVLHPLIVNIQTSWAKMGREGAGICLQAGANDLGGTLMNESISRAAGATHGQEMTPADIEAVIRSVGRVPIQRNTLYEPVTRRDYVSAAQLC